MAKKKYTSEEIRERNFQRITGKTREEYQNEWRSANSNLYETRARYLQRDLDNKTPDYKFTAEKPKKQNYVRDVLSNPHTGSPWDASNAVYDMDKYNEDLAKYNTAVSEANKRAISDITKKEQQGEAVKGLPVLTQQKMIKEMEPYIETDSFQRIKNIVAAERQKDPEAFEKAVAKGKSEAEKHSYYNTMSGDERTELAYLIGSGNEINLEAYLKSGESTFKQKKADRNALAVKKKAEQNPTFGVAANLAGGIVSPTSYIGEVVNQGAGLFTGVNEPLPEYSKWNTAARIEKSSREGLTEGKSETPAFLINVGLSIGQNLVRLPLSIFGGGTGEVLSLVSMASSAAGQTVYEAVQRGATGGQALLLGTVAGGVEYLTEKISLDKLLNLGKDSVRIFSKEAAQGIVRQMVSEGGEEMISEVANIIADSLIMGDKSELISMYNSYLESGMSKKDAEANTIWHTVLNIGLAGIGGALSGGVLGGGGTVVGAITHNLNTETQNAANERGLESLIDEGKTYGTDTGAYKVATKAEERIAKGKKVGKYMTGQLYNENAIAQKEQLEEVEKTVEKAKAEEMKSEAKTEDSETANGFTFEKAEEPKIETKLPKPYEATAVERFNALGVNGRQRYSEIANNLMDENGSFDENSFARDFERAYVLGHLGVTEQQIMQHLNIDVSSNPILNTAFNSGGEDRTAELTAAQQKVQQGIPSSVEKGLEPNAIARSLSPKSYSVWDKVGKQLGVKIQLVDNIDGNKDVMGKYKDGVIQVNVKGDRPMWSIAAHEVTHRIKEVSPKAFEAFKSEVVSALGTEYENRYNEVAKRYRMTGEKTNAEIEEEVISEYAEELFDSEEKFEQLAKKNSSLAERLINAIKEFIGKIKAALGKGTSAETNQLDSIVKAWENAYSKAVETVGKANVIESESAPKSALRKNIEDMDEGELRARVTELEQQNQNLAKSVYEGVITPSKTKMQEISRDLVKKYGSKYASTSLAKGLFDRLVEIDSGYDKNGKALNQWEIERNLKNTLRPVIQEAVEIDSERYDELSEVRKAVRGSEVRIRRLDAQDFGSDEDFNEFRKTIFGRIPNLRVVNDNTDNVDSVYFALNDKFGDDIFPMEITSAADQLRTMAEVYDLAQITEKNIYEGQEDLALNALVNDVYDAYMELRHSPSGEKTSDIRTRGRLENLKAKGKLDAEAQELFRKIREDGRKTVAEWKEAARKEVAELEKDIKQRTREDLEKEKEKLKESNKKAIKKTKEKLREAFKTNAQIMKANFYERQRIIKENKTKTPVVKAFEGASKHLLKVGNKMLTTEILDYLEEKTVGKMRAYTQDDDSVKTMDVLEHFVEKLIAGNSDVTWSDEVDERKRAIERRDRESYIDTRVHGVDSVLDQIDFIARVLRDISMSKEMNFTQMAESAVRDMNNAISDEEAEKFKTKKLRNSLRENLMTPRTFLRFIGGYTDGVFDDIADMLETSEDRSRLIRRDLKDMFSKLVSDKQYKDFKTRKIVLKVGEDFSTRQSNVSDIVITPDMLTALVKHSQNEKNMNHIEPNDSKNGIQIPSVDRLAKGDTDSAWDNKPIVNFTKEQITRLANKYLTKYDNDFLSTYTQFADVVCKKLLNEASMDAYGTIVAPVENYMHIRIVPGFKGSQTAQLFGEDRKAKEISGSGSLKARAAKATEPILLEPLSLAIEDQIELVSEYAGKAGTDQRIRKMVKTRVLQDGNEVTFTNVLRNRWGTFGSKNWNNIMFDFNGNSRSDYNTFAKLRSNYAIARLGLNFKSIAVQPTAAITAFAELGFNSGFGNIKGNKLTLKDLAPYTARATDRAEGLINAELAERYGAKAGFDKAAQWTMRWITSHDVIAVKWIIPMAQRYVERHSPDIRINSTEYVKEVARVFEWAINRTQTGATAMLRPELYRGNNYLLKLVNFMGSESLKNGNIIIDARRNVKAKKKRAKSNPTEENKQLLVNARKEYHRKLNAIRLTNLASTLIGAVIAAVFQGKWEKYVDEDGDLGLSDLGKASMQIVSDYVDSMLSSFFFHDKVWAIAEGVIKGESPDFRYELNQSIPELEAVYGAVEDVYRIYDAIIDYNSEMSDKNAEKLLSLVGHAANTAVGSIVTLIGIPTENVFKEVFGIAETVSKLSNTSEGVLAQYELLKMQQSVYKSSNRGKVYDLLYQAYLLDDRTAYRNIRRDLLEKGYTHQALDSAIEKRRKEDREKQRKK